MTTNNDIRELEARAYIMKCAGAGLQACARCTRLQAPAAEGDQRWIEPTINGGICGYVADVGTYALFYQPLPEGGSVSA